MQRLILGVILLVCTLSAQEAPTFTRQEDVIYGRKHGTALTLDVFEPAKKNGCGIVYMVSGGWFSSHASVNAANYKVYLDRGYTVFAVVHGSQPKFHIPEAQADVHRAVRFIRSNAAKWNVAPDKLGVTGGSAGGHLSLSLGTQGAPGPADSKDPVDRQSSAVQAVACFYPPTDFLNYGREGEDATGVGTLKNYKGAFGPRVDSDEDRRKYAREISPIYHITKGTPPTLIIHGDADLLVPIYQAQSFIERAQAAGVKAKLVVKKGAAHGWKDMGADMVLLADWFDEHLRGGKN